VDCVERLRATYTFEPVDHLVRREFYIWPEALERWKGEGMPEGVPEAALFGFDEPGGSGVWHLGWCEPAFVPAIEPRVVETHDDYEIVLDNAGRTVQFFRGRRHGFMPVYLKHAVACERDWEEDVVPLLAVETPERWAGFDKELDALAQADAAGRFITQHCVGGYMYLRALVGPQELCYMLVDAPGLIHRMMEAWLALAEAVTRRVQARVDLDEFFIGEDICYNHGLLISPDMVREFLFPYYQQLLDSIRRRQRRKHLHFHNDTDGNVHEAIDLYRELGMDVMSPFEIASHNDVLAISRKYPDLVMLGGIDKRVLAQGADAIDRYLDALIPPMVDRGGYVPTCDHGVPDNVSYADYMHYRRRMMELDH
jgi:uroporphyrinogen decarboxylase